MSVVKELPNGWNLVQFSDVCEIVSGKNQKDVVNDSGAYPIYGSGGKMGYANDYLCDPCTTIVGRKGTINKPIFVKEKFWNVDTAFGLSPYEGINKLLFHYFCLSFNFKGLDKSTTIPSLAKTDLLQIKFPLPPLKEQSRIVSKLEELFSDLDKGIESLKTAQGQLKTYRQAVLKFAFEGKLTNKNVKEGELPEEWKWVKLKSIADITSSKRIFQHEYVSEGIPFYRTKEIKELSEGQPLSVDLYISFEKHNEIKSRFQIPKIGEVLLSAVGTIGVSYVIKDNKPFYFKDGNLMWLRDLNGILPNFLSYGLTNYIRNKKGAKTSGSAYNALTIETMKEFDFPLPSILEQQRIVLEIESRLSVCDKMEESITQSLVKAEALRQSILKKAFEGKLVPQDPNDLPASVLLERIRAEREKNKPMKAAKQKRAGGK